MIKHGEGPLLLPLGLLNVSFCLTAHLVRICTCDIVILEDAPFDVFFSSYGHNWNFIDGLLMDDSLWSGPLD